MAVSDPYPGQPALNSALASPPILAKFNALFQGVQAFDGSQINAGTVAASALASNINPNTLLHDTISPFVQSGCIWAAVSGFAGTMTGGIIYAGTSSAVYRVVVNSVGSHTFAASQDTYVDIDYNGNITYVPVANGAYPPTITANALRVALVISGASAITSVSSFSMQSWLPTFTNFTLGNGTISYAQYMQVGKKVYFEMKVILGSTSVVSGQIGVSPPVTLATIEGSTPFGQPVGISNFDSTAAFYSGIVLADSSGNLEPWAQLATGTYVNPTGTSSTVPFTWATSSRIWLTGTYHAA